MTDLFSPNCSLDRIKNLTHGNSTPTVSLQEHEDIKINIRPNKEIAPALFKPDPLIPGGHIAHPTTIRAMRKEIFCTGFDVDLNEKLIICHSCKQELDLQFWHFCPFCEASLSTK